MTQLENVDTVLFDLDGTLLDNIPTLVSSVCHAVYSELGLDIPECVIYPYIGGSLEVLLGSLTTNAELSGVREGYEAHYASSAEKLPLFEGTRTVLSSMRLGGFSVGLVTSRKKRVMEDLSETDILRYFDAIVTGKSGAPPKPSPEPYLLAADLLCSRPGKCVVVGDTLADIEAARTAGMASVAITHGAHSIDQLDAARPTALCHNLGQLLEILGVPLEGVEQ